MLRQIAEMSCDDMMSPLNMQKTHHCLHEHWKNCLDFPEVHMFVLHPAPPEEDDNEDLYASPEKLLRVAQLVSSITEYPEDSTGFCAVRTIGT
jgi:hypothetical protein